VVVPTTIKDTVVNARLDSELVAQLDELAAGMQRTRSFLIAEAVREYVEREYAHLSAVGEGDADIEAGRYLTGDEMTTWIEDLKAGRVKGPPTFKGSRKK
jgi:predicted transcriptional regulator